jgi:hypothetical protein
LEICAFIVIVVVVVVDDDGLESIREAIPMRPLTKPPIKLSMKPPKKPSVNLP